MGLKAKVSYFIQMRSRNTSEPMEHHPEVHLDSRGRCGLDLPRLQNLQSPRATQDLRTTLPTHPSRRALQPIRVHSFLCDCPAAPQAGPPTTGQVPVGTRALHGHRLSKFRHLEAGWAAPFHL